MLGLKLPTDLRWVHLAQTNLSALLTDHAYCEQKAASNAISTLVRYPEHPELVRTLAQIAQEEMAHFEQVHEHIVARGWVLGPERKDAYVNELASFMKKGVSRNEALAERLLFAAMIEARSCERFKLLAEHCDDAELRGFYHELMISEAGHYTTFLKLARRLCGDTLYIDARWQAWLAFEAGVIARYGVGETMHG